MSLNKIMIEILLLAIATIFGFGVWASSTENTCWQNQATTAFEKYSSQKSRSAVLRAATDSEILESKANLVEVLEHEFNGCSLGSNGSTVLRFYFNDSNKLTMMQAFRHYGGVKEMQLIEERKFDQGILLEQHNPAFKMDALKRAPQFNVKHFIESNGAFVVTLFAVFLYFRLTNATLGSLLLWGAFAVFGLGYHVVSTVGTLRSSRIYAGSRAWVSLARFGVILSSVYLVLALIVTGLGVNVFTGLK